MMSRSGQGNLLSLRELFVLLLLALPLVVTVSVIEAAEWIDGLPSLIALVLVSPVAWAFLARSRLPWWIGHPVAFVAGLVVAFILGALTLSENSGLADLTNQLRSWFGAVGGSGEDRGESMVGVGLIAITLWMAHASVWLSYRRTFALLAMLPGLGVLLVVLTFLPSDYYWYFFMYLLASAPGIAYRYKGHWFMRGQRVPLVGTLVASAVLMGATVAPVWQAPAPEGVVIPLVSLVEDPWYSFQEKLSSLFYGVPDRKRWPFFSPPYNLPFTGPVEPSDNVLFEVKSQEPHRWRMRVYDTYIGTGWVSDEDLAETASSKASLREYVEELEAREEVKINVRIFSKGTTLLSAGEPLGASITSDVELSPQPGFKLYLEGTQVGYIPPELQKYRSTLQAMLPSSRRSELFQPGEPASFIKPPDWLLSHPVSDGLGNQGFQLASTTESASYGLTLQPEDAYLVVERTEPGPAGPPLAFLGRRILVPPQRYSTLGSVSKATPDMLRRAGQDYPEWVTDRYLQLPNSFPQTVRDLARDLTREETDPYDKAEAIRRHLLSLPYSLDVVLPNPGQDWVEFFLLEQRRGYCQNYASAMVTMLRSLGIPARMAVGFAPGIWDQQRGVWVVQARHYHAWPEVYFPSYGWVEFEPTPANVQPALEHLGFLPQRVALLSTQDIDECAREFELGVGIGDCGEQPVSDGTIIEPFDEPRDRTDEAVAGDNSGGGGLGFLSSPWTLLGLGAVLVLVVPLGTFTYIRRGILRLGYPAITYASMSFLGRLAGVGLRSQDTPWEYGARLSQVIPRHTEAVTHITQGFVNARYSPSKGLIAEEKEEVRTSWRKVRRALLGRILLRLLPRRNFL